MKNDEQNFMPFIKLRYQNSLEMSPNSTLAKPYLKNIGSCAKVSFYAYGYAPAPAFSYGLPASKVST